VTIGRSALRLPRVALFACAAVLLGTFVQGPFGSAASSFRGALAAGFTMAGLAMLHARTRGMAGRTAVLVLAYLSIAFIAFTAIFFFIAGVIGAGRRVPLSPAVPSNPNSTNND
jgi:hypothetical protein